MLILVAVTVNLANENGGLFVKTREAKQDTAYKAEEENLLTYIYEEGVYNAKTGEVKLDVLQGLLTDTTKWQNPILDDEENPTKLTVTGVQSGEEHIINKNGVIGDKKYDATSTIAGTYYDVFSRDSAIQLNEDGTGKSLVINDDGTYDKEEGIQYNYSSETKTGTIIMTISEETVTVPLSYITIKDENENEINSGILLEFNNGSECEYAIFMKNGNTGTTILPKNIYSNGNKTIEFNTGNKNGETWGWCVIRENGTVMNSGEDYYICINGRIITSNYQLDSSYITINSEYSELTVIENGTTTVYKKQ